MIGTIKIARSNPTSEARALVGAILADGFAPDALDPAVNTLATRVLYPPAADFLAGIVCGAHAPGRHTLIEHLIDPAISLDIRARRVAGDVGLIRRDSSTHGYAFGFDDLCAATSIAPLARLALATLGYSRDTNGPSKRLRRYHLGAPWPLTKRERAALALHYLCGRATTLRRGAL